AELDGIRKTREGFAAEHDAMVAKARDDAEKERAVLLEKARQDAEALQARANAAIAADKLAAKSEWAERSRQLAVDIARMLVSPLRAQTVQDEFADRLIAAIGKLPDGTREAARNGSKLEALSATPVPADRQEDIRQRIGKVLGGAPPISFKTDPSLIAGIELRGPHLVITNSWKADLDRILGEVSHGN
ncbi:MAG: F0F1 ATP synthase subunit delta, partial [Alphaproteobacteria bacterium]|nr:F0F1 ATP synthase subunit delta [Alphaproteobacteria bacterium]